jgi:lipoprotein-anchoring transpeptidase ErfK/SrfK
MSQTLLRTLNPKADFTAAGSTVVVVRPGAGELGAPVAKIEVDKAANQVRAMDGGGKLLGIFPATVGSTERPAPTGQWAVKTVVHDPDYSYDPRRLTFGDKSEGALRIAPGPNNPVGTTWIALTVETYGIHGTPDPTKVGKTASHGCIRLTNWDAALLGRSLAKGTPVVFVGETSKS